MYPAIMIDIKSGLFPATILVRNDLIMETGQLQAKQSSMKISQILKLLINQIKINNNKQAAKVVEN